MAFAILKPINEYAENAFKEAYATLEDSSDPNHKHLRQMFLFYENTAPSGSISGAATGSVKGQGTPSVPTGRFMFDLNALPRLPKNGWMIGIDKNKVDIDLAPTQPGRPNGVCGLHARLFLEPDSNRPRNRSVSYGHDDPSSGYSPTPRRQVHA